MAEVLSSGDALLVVDVQVDFCPGGALPVAQGDQVIAPLNRWMDRFHRTGLPIFLSRDWHPANHISFKARGGPWPPHCVQRSPGAAFHRGLRVPEKVAVVSKGDDPDREAYSPFDGTDLARQLRRLGITRLTLGGLALDYCVRAAASDALREGFQVRLLLEATRAIDARPGDGARAIESLRRAGVEVVGEAGGMPAGAGAPP